MVVSTTVTQGERLPDGKWAPGNSGRHSRDQRFLDAIWAKLDEVCPYDPLHRRYFDYMVSQAVDDATEDNPKYRYAAREWLTNRLLGLPRATIDTRLEIDAHINADALEIALRPILEAQQAMIAQYRQTSVEGTYTLLPSDEVQSSITSETPELASE